ncbi:GerAB/ArcD/ProY family transporter [Cohnella hashimotonis]|uniref:GerAB/ArcD/ProY family transporter n=1 Tax=Cohnella hashimotonis TaxID=2826895 RepID=A0ABT6TPF1_9BACL|nr:GerAB/ArcD/ProY family transporter [Cohnella hashimotonis]
MVQKSGTVEGTAGMNDTNSAVRLSDTQYFIMQLAVFGATSYFLYPYLILHTDGGSYWMPIVTGLLAGILGARLFSGLMAQYPGLDAFAAVKRVLGWPGLLLFAIPYGWYIWRAMTMIARAHAEIVSMTILHTTPLWILHCTVPIAMLLAAGGVASIVRAAAVFVTVGIPVTIGITLLGFSDLDLALHEPWRPTDLSYLGSQSFFKSSFVWVGFLYLCSCGQYARIPGRLWRPYAAAAFCFLPVIAAAIYFPVLTFGVGFAKALTFPFLSKMDSVSHYWLVVENLTAVFLSAVILLVILTLSLMMHSLVAALRALMPFLSARFAYAAVGASTYISAQLIPSWGWIEKGIWADTPVRIYLVLFPPVVWLWRRLASGRRQSA